jgi:hypothetical protein
MKKKKIANYLKTGILLVSVSLLLWNCEKNDVLENVNQLSVPSIEQSKNAFLANKKLSKGTNSFISKIMWDESSEILYKDDIKVLNSPLKVNSSRIKSFVASVEKDGKIENKVITLVFDDDSNNNYFSGKLFIHNGDGSYDNGFKYEKGKKIGVYKINSSTYKSKGNCTPVTLTVGELIMMYEAGMIGGSETELFGCEVEIESVGEGDDGGGNNNDEYWDWPNDDYTDDGPHGSGENWWSPTLQVFNELTNQCGYDIFEELRKGIYKFDPNKHDVPISTPIGDFNLSEKILFLFSESYKSNYTIKNGTTGGSNASTDLRTNTTTMSDVYLQNATKLSIARTMIHEQIHAYLNNIFKLRTGFKDFTLYKKLTEFAKSQEINDPGRLHHEFMASFVDGIALSLSDWDFENGNTLLDKSYYMSMAYAGLYYDNNPDPNITELVDTDSFKALVPNETDRNNIKKIISDETTGKPSAKGKKCNP